MSEADDKSSATETREGLLQSGLKVQVAVTQPENADEAMKPIIVFPVAHQYSA